MVAHGVTEPQPAVSVITAAYNRSNVLIYAISSVIWQTCADWELIVVDDASTDDTAAVVASFADPRIRYIRLEENIGEQSGPNNIGFKHARGRYIAYLNQDDLWFPDHLEKVLQTIRETDADWVCTAGIALHGNHEDMYLCGVMPDDQFSPRYSKGINATLWLIKREVLEETGGWRFYRTLHIPPSQDLMYRAWKQGKTIKLSCLVTAIVIHSGSLFSSYSHRLYEENQFYFDAIKSKPCFREELLSSLYYSYEKKNIKDSLSITFALYRMLVVLIKRVGLLFGIMPSRLSFFFRYLKKGAFVDQLRKNRGLPRLK